MLLHHCQVCHNITETDMFICNNDQRSYKINHSFDCNEKCLIYLLTCNCCQKQYVHQTIDIFRNRWNNYKNIAKKCDRGEHCMQRQLHEHFTVPGHSGFIHDVSITLIDKNDPRCPTKCKDYWTDTVKIKAPMGLNFVLMIVSEQIVWYFYISATGFGWLCFRTEDFGLATYLCF